MKHILPVRLLFFTALSLALHAGIVAVADRLVPPLDLRQARANAFNLTLSTQSAVTSENANLSDTRTATNMQLPGARGLIDAIAKPTTDLAPVSYLPASALDERPTPVRFFDFSDLALPSPARGKLIVQLWINEWGTIDFLEIEENDAPEIMLEALHEQWRALQFLAGTRDGIRVKSVVSYEVTLAPEAPGESIRTARIITP